MMPVRSAIVSLPDDIRQQLEQKLLTNGFSGYVDLEGWLESLGYQISKSAIHRYGSAFERRMAAVKVATDQARALVAATPDDAGAMNEALVRMTQHQIFEVLVNLSESDDKDPLEAMPKIAQAVARLTMSSVRQKQWAQDVANKAQAAASQVEETARKAGLSDDVLSTIRAQILGISQ